MKQPWYGIDAPYSIRNLVIAGIVLPFLYHFFFSWLYKLTSWKIFFILGHWITACVVAACYLLAALFMVLSSLYGKIKQREKILNLFSWQGDEQVLDVGCGQGLYLVGIAQRLTTGKVVGVDIWTSDLSGNSKQTAEQNACIAGVEKRIEIKTADARSLPFPDNSFDRIFSSLVIHNLAHKQDHEKALLEMVRVLKPAGGTIVIQDIAYTKRYEQFLRQKGLQVYRSGVQFFIFPPVHFVVAHK